MSDRLLRGGEVPYGLGVDLGTTFVAAAISHPGRIEMVLLGDHFVVAPALVFLDGGTLVVGDAARRRGLSSPERLGRGIKRRLGDPTPVILGGVPHAVQHLLGVMLRDVVRKISESQDGPPDNIVLTLPANWDPAQRRMFEQAATAAGLYGAVTVTDAVAVAAHYASYRYRDDGEIVAIYDLGGGTFDAAVLRIRPYGVEVLGTPAGERLGGMDFDDAIMSYVNHRSDGALSELDPQDPQTAVALARLRQDCVLAKETLSTDTEMTLPVFLPDRHFDVLLTRSDLENMLRAPIRSTIGALLRTLRSARVSPRDLGAVVMVGGSSRIPLVNHMVSEALGRPALVSLHPDHAVALGAAALAARLPSRARARTRTAVPPDGPVAWPRPARPGPAAPRPPLPPPPMPARPTPQPRLAGPTSGPPPTPTPSTPVEPLGTRRPDDPAPPRDEPGAEVEWHAPAIGRTLVVGITLLALIVVIGLIAYVVISRL